MYCTVLCGNSVMYCAVLYIVLHCVGSVQCTVVYVDSVMFCTLLGENSIMYYTVQYTLRTIQAIV